MIDPRLERDIGRAEADKLVAYRDSLGYWTIGRGHFLGNDHDWTGYTITAEQDETYFQGDVQQATAFAQRLPEWGACDTVCRQNALIELCFNMRGKWLGFHHCRAAWQIKDWQTAHDQLLASTWETQVHAERADRIANYILTGEYP